MRTIIRFSINGESNSRLRNRLATILQQHGFHRGGGRTATYEHADIGEAQLAAAMLEFWAQAQNAPNQAHLDHFWMYSDTASGASG